MKTDIELRYKAYSIHIDTSGEMIFSKGDMSVRCAPQAHRSCRIAKMGDRLTVDRLVGPVRLQHTLSLAEDGDQVSLFVTCRIVVAKPTALKGLVDRWMFPSHDFDEFRWAPNLRPGENLRIGSHCFRSPVVALAGSAGWGAIIPDFKSAAARESAVKCALDLDVKSHDRPILAYGIEATRPFEHVYFEVDPSVTAEGGQILAFDYFVLLESQQPRNVVLRRVNQFLWARFASPYLDSPLPQTLPFDKYAERAYTTLLSSPPWVEFEIEDQHSGGISAEAAHAGYFGRPHPVVWNQFWFNAQRTAYGLGAFGKQKGREEWLRAGRMITAVTLAAPDWGGLWPALYAYEDREWFGSIPRLNGGPRRVHVADAAMTAEWLLHWVLDVEPNPRANRRIIGLAERLCAVQADDGSIPPWFDWDGAGLTANPVLERSAETGAAGALLAELSRHPEFQTVNDHLLRCAQFLAERVMPGQLYQDFETFFSCSKKPLDMADPFTGIAPQNSLAVFWVARTMLGAYGISKDEAHLRLAVEATDTLSLYQQIWNPPFLSLYAFGGFGVMNTDAEWNDARQSLFAPHYFRMYESTGTAEYLERGAAALRASFVLASVPENADVSPNTFQSYAPGLMPENYGHSGGDTPAGRSDACWGEGGALSSVAWLRNHHAGTMIDVSES